MNGDAQEQTLAFGALNLIGSASDLARDGYKFSVLSDETSFGDPVPVEAQIVSWLEDAALVEHQGFTNRTFSVRVQVEGGNSNDLARAKAALDFETEKRNQLTWTPPDGFGAPSVFEIVMSHSKHSMDDMAETLYNERIYTIDFQAEAFVHAQELTVVTQPAPPSGGPTVRSIDTCTATTNWYDGNNSVTSSGGAVRSTRSWPANIINYFAYVERRALSEDMTGTRYLRIDWGASVTPASAMPTPTPKVEVQVASGDSRVLPMVAAAGSVRWYDFGTSGETIIDLFVSIEGTSPGTNPAFVTKVWVNDISASDSLVDPGATNRQLSRSIPVKGSARAPGSLAIEDAAAALGDCLVFTYPTATAILQPNIRRFLTSGNTETPDSATVSGKTSDLATLHTFDLPADQLLPGGYLILARIKHAAAGTYSVTWAAKTRQGSTTISGGVTGTASIVIDTNGEYDIVTIAKPTLPPRLLGANGVVRIELTGAAGLVLDEAWVCNVEVGQLSQFTLGSGTPTPGGVPNRAWLDAPTLDNPRRALFVGTEADRSDSYHLENGMISLDLHELVPPSTTAFIVTCKSTAAQMTASYYAAFQSHVVNDDE